MKSSTDKTAETVGDAAVENEASEVSSNGAPVGSDDGNQITELRRLLVGSEEISVVLPDAVAKSSKHGSQLSEATLPIVEENIRESVIRNPRILADALFPVIGPAIRKAISAALSSMVQSFNQTLEHSVSPKGLRWRLEAMRTGRSFGEVVMLKTLQYRVEQVFLIHRETGLLLEHVSQNPQDTEDGDMVSAMLTAITDFAHDSFKTDEDATLDSFKISGLNVWIEGSPGAILAAVIRGNPPLELRETFSLAVEKIQYSFEREFKAFEGDADIFAGSRPVLQGLLVFQAAETEKKSSFSLGNIVLGFLGLSILIAAVYFTWDYWRWSGLLEDIRKEPGYVLTDYNRGWMTHSITGLRDPLAGSPAELLSKNNYDADDVTFDWREFQDSDSRFAVERARRLLKPPPGVELSLKSGVLVINGAVSPEWANEAGRLAPLITGVTSIRIEGGGTLVSSIEARKLLFNCGTTELKSKSEMDAVAVDFRKLAVIGGYNVDIIGHADKTGSPEINSEISKKRAEVVGAAIRVGIAGESLSGKLDFRESGSETTSDECTVTFKVTPLNQ